MAETLAKNKKLDYFESSAKDNTGIDDIFRALTKKALIKKNMENSSRRIGCEYLFHCDICLTKICKKSNYYLHVTGILSQFLSTLNSDTVTLGTKKNKKTKKSKCC